MVRSGRISGLFGFAMHGIFSSRKRLSLKQGTGNGGTGNGGTGNGERGTGNGESLKGGISKRGNL